MLLDYQLFDVNAERAQIALVWLLNRAIRSEGIYDPVRFAHVRFSPRTRELLSQKPQTGEALVYLNRSLIEDAYPLEISAMSESSLLKFKSWEVSHLRWLSSWLGIDLDQRWLEGNADRRKAWAIIKEAAQLYRHRGTCYGVTKILSVFYDWDVEIIESSWPRGFQIGVSSIIDIDCVLMDEIEPEFQFTVLIRSTERNRERLFDVGSRVVSLLAGEGSERQIASVLCKSTVEPTATATISKLRELIDQEKPVQTYYYLALEPSENPKEATTVPSSKRS